MSRHLWLALLCLIFVALSVCCFDLHYTVNDDIGIIEFITDGYSVPYVGILFSGTLHLLYSIAPGVAWFGLVLYALHALGMFLWVMLVWRVFRNRWLAAACTLIVFGYYLWFLTSLDFTAASIMLCMVGVAWACIQVVERRQGVLRFLAPGLVFMLGMLVRPQGAPGALVYALPLAIIAVISCMREHEPILGAKRLGLAALLFLSPAILNFGVDTIWREAVRTPQEAQYEAFNSAGTRFSHLSLDRINAVSRDETLLRSVHWTRHDLTYFEHWEFLDERIYTPEALETLWADAPPAVFTNAALKQIVIERLPPYNRAFLLLVAGLPFFLYLFWVARDEAVIGVLLPPYCVAVTVFMYLQFAFHDRLELPFETGLGLSSLLMAGLLSGRGQWGRDRSFLWAACVSLAIAFSGLGLSARSFLEGQHEASGKGAQMQSRLHELNTAFAGSVILLQPNSLDLTALSPLEPIELRFRPIELGWNTFSPRFYRQIGALGIEHGYQLVDALIDKPGAYLLGPQKWCQSLLSYATDAPKRDIRVVPIGTDLCRLDEKKH